MFSASRIARWVATLLLYMSVGKPLIGQEARAERLRAALDSLGAISCSEPPSSLKTREDVTNAFQCRGDRSYRVLLALSENTADMQTLIAIQNYAWLYTTDAVLTKAFELATSAPTAANRFLGLSILVSSINSHDSFSPADTVTGPYWGMSSRSHGLGTKDPVLRARASVLLASLAESSPFADVRERSAVVLWIHKIQDSVRAGRPVGRTPRPPRLMQ